MNKDFLLNSDTAKILYEYAKTLPIIDYHNHLSTADISENKRFLDIYDLWIKPDPYKHRAMRMCGVEEKYIIGDTPNPEKFKKWCKTVPMLVGNPLYHWTLMELSEIFGISEIPNKENAEEIYERCNLFLKSNEVTPRAIFEKFGVEFVCPCTSITDDINVLNEKVRPSLRGDDIVNVNFAFIQKLSFLSKIKIDDLKSFEEAVKIRLKAFYGCGCRFSDHALDNGFKFYEDDGNNEKRFKAVLENSINEEDKERLASYILVFLTAEYEKLGFILQLHIGAQRYTSTKLRKTAGLTGGFAGIGNSVIINSLTKFLDTVDCGEYGLPKTVLFTLNPADNALISVLSGSFSKDGVSGLITQGPAWWWCDHKLGITDMLEITAAFSVLSNFIGMTTDSRSFLSFVRHDYFRRILCDWIGTKVEDGEFPDDMKELENLIHRMCYKNARELIL